MATASLGMIALCHVFDWLGRFRDSDTAIALSRFQLPAHERVSKTEFRTMAQSLNGITQQLKKIMEWQQAETRLRERTQLLENTLVELWKTQAHLIQAEKMSSLGQLVAGISHEINNPVNFIQGNLHPAQTHVQDLLTLLDLYQTHVPNPPAPVQAFTHDIDLEFIREDVLKLLSSMRTGTHRIREVVQSLHNFSRLDEADIKVVDLHEGLENTLAVLGHRLTPPHGPKVQIIRDYGALPRVECCARSLNQVFMSIFSNALDAFEELAETQTADTRAGRLNHIKIRTQVKDGQSVQIRIADNGPGIPESVRKRMFDPFFTTKSVGKGTGMGLAISYQIIVEHQGNLSCTSTPGQGTEFVIEIPVHQVPLPQQCSF
jgi:two-component system, NtrC family, sensor kinase